MAAAHDDAGRGPKTLATSKLRRSSAQYKSFNCTSAQASDPVLSYQASKRRSAPRRRGPAKILAIDGTWGDGQVLKSYFQGGAELRSGEDGCAKCGVSGLEPCVERAGYLGSPPFSGTARPSTSRSVGFEAIGGFYDVEFGLPSAEIGSA